MPATTTTTTTTTPEMVTTSKALDLERRLNVLESRVGVSHLNDANSAETVDDRLAKLRLELERKICTSNTVRANEQSWKEIQKLLKELDPGIALTHQQQPLLYKRQDVLAGSDQLSRDFRELDAILKLLLTGTTVDGADRVVPASAAANTTSSGGGTTKPSSSNFSTPVKGLGLGTMSAGSSVSVSPTKPQKPGSSSLQQHSQALPTRELQQKLKLAASSGPSKPSGSSTSEPRTSGGTLRLDSVTQAPILVQHAAAGIVHQNHKRVEDLRSQLSGLHGRTQSLQQELRTLLECYHTAAMAVSEKIVKADERIEAKLAEPQFL